MNACSQQVEKIVKDMLTLPRETRIGKILDFLGVKRVKIANRAGTNPAMIPPVVKSRPNFKSSNVENAIYAEIVDALARYCPDYKPTFLELFDKNPKKQKAA